MFCILIFISGNHHFMQGHLTVNYLTDSEVEDHFFKVPWLLHKCVGMTYNRYFTSFQKKLYQGK
jgi:hypothetical protein